jgi:hypothetical protein
MMRGMQAELEFYREASKYTPWMSDNKKKPRNPPVSHLEAAASELRGAFHFEVSKVMRNVIEDSESSPFLLVATRVRNNWREFQTSFRTTMLFGSRWYRGKQKTLQFYSSMTWLGLRTDRSTEKSSLIYRPGSMRKSLRDVHGYGGRW